MRSRLLSLLFLASLALSLGCGEEKTIIYMYPETSGDAAAAADSPLNWGDGAGQDLSKADGVSDSSTEPGPDVEETSPEPLPDTSTQPEPFVEVSTPEPTPEAQPEPEPEVVSPEPEPEVVLPEVTDDCDPLGVPSVWSGTFEGDIESNIPDMGNYTFEGPVYGAIDFEISCHNQKFVVFGELDGGATNCALVSGCPFKLTLSGYYDAVERKIYGQLLDGSINYTVLIVYAEGAFDGVMDDDATEILGTWSGDKTDISLPSLSWVEATGTGTWEAQPVE